MKETHAYLEMLEAPMVLYFDYYNNVPASDSDKIIEHYHELSKVYLGSKHLEANQYFSALDTLQNKAVDSLSDFYYERIESPAALQAVFNDLDQQLSEITGKYHTINIEGRSLNYSTRIVLQVEVAKEKSPWTNEESPFYTGLNISELTVNKHFQVLRIINQITEKEVSGIEAFRQVLNKFDTESPKEVFHESLPGAVLTQVYETFAEYFDYQSEAEFVQAVKNLERIKYTEMYSNHLAYLFYMLLKSHKVKGRSHVLQKLFGVKNKSREQISEKPILSRIDDFLESFDENFDLE